MSTSAADLSAALDARLRDASHLIKDIALQLAACKTAKQVVNLATQERARAVRGNKYMVALIYDEVIRRAEGL